MPRRGARPSAEHVALPPLATLAAAPLANPLGHSIPGGKPKRAKRRPTEEQLALFANLPAQQQLSRNARLAIASIHERAAMLDHYARTDVELASVASHCGIAEDEARAELARRGRYV